MPANPNPSPMICRTRSLNSRRTAPVATICGAMSRNASQPCAIGGTREGRSNRVNVIHPIPNAIVRHSNAGISSDQSASAGQVDHSDIASAPTHVHVFGDHVRAQAERAMWPRLVESQKSLKTLALGGRASIRRSRLVQRSGTRLFASYSILLACG